MVYSNNSLYSFPVVRYGNIMTGKETEDLVYTDSENIINDFKSKWLKYLQDEWDALLKQTLTYFKYNDQKLMVDTTEGRTIILPEQLFGIDSFTVDCRPSLTFCNKPNTCKTWLRLSYHSNDIALNSNKILNFFAEMTLIGKSLTNFLTNNYTKLLEEYRAERGLNPLKEEIKTKRVVNIKIAETKDERVKKLTDLIEKDEDFDIQELANKDREIRSVIKDLINWEYETNSSNYKKFESGGLEIHLNGLIHNDKVGVFLKREWKDNETIYMNLTGLAFASHNEEKPEKTTSRELSRGFLQFISAKY